MLLMVKVPKHWNHYLFYHALLQHQKNDNFVYGCCANGVANCPPPPNKHLAKFTATYIKAQAPSVATHFGETYLAAKFGRPEILQKCSLGLSIHVSEELQQWSVGYEQLLHSRSISIYEGRQSVLFYNYDIHQTRMLQIMLGIFGKLLTKRVHGVHGLWVHGLCFHDVWTCGAKVLEY